MRKPFTISSLSLTKSGGIGPEDQLAVVKGSADAETMIAEDDWITLPVGNNLEDHTNVSSPDVKPIWPMLTVDRPIRLLRTLTLCSMTFTRRMILLMRQMLRCILVSIKMMDESQNEF